mmetsp:Transcript_3589/g.9303  ORF Transcript_3589/g.9303 Transcript_3589/m.9303 type:complete len:273 (+) Transcript_3589:1545-2363(+)
MRLGPLRKLDEAAVGGVGDQKLLLDGMLEMEEGPPRTKSVASAAFATGEEVAHTVITEDPVRVWIREHQIKVWHWMQSVAQQEARCLLVLVKHEGLELGHVHIRARALEHRVHVGMLDLLLHKVEGLEEAVVRVGVMVRLQARHDVKARAALELASPPFGPLLLRELRLEARRPRWQLTRFRKRSPQILLVGLLGRLLRSFKALLELLVALRHLGRRGVRRGPVGDAEVLKCLELHEPQVSIRRPNWQLVARLGRGHWRGCRHRRRSSSRCI